MQYPLDELLPYGLRCRLRELSTPLEAYKLQTVLGNNDLAGLLPLQDVVHREEFRIKKLYFPEQFFMEVESAEESPSFIEKYGLTGNGRTALFNAGIITFSNVPSHLFNIEIMNRFYVNELTLLRIEQDEKLIYSFLEAVALRMYKVEILELKTPYCNIPYNEVLLLFPHLSIAKVHFVHDRWIQALLAVNARNLRLHIAVDRLDFDDLFSFDSDELSQFVERNNKLKITYNSRKELGRAEKTVFKKMKYNFQQTKKFSDSSVVFNLYRKRIMFEPRKENIPKVHTVLLELNRCSIHDGDMSS